MSNPRPTRTSPHRRRHHRRRSPVRALVALVAIAAGVAGMATASFAQGAATETVVFDDGLGPGFGDWSWADTDLTSTDEVAGGTTAIRADLGPWGGLSLGNSDRPAAPVDGVLRFSVHGGDNAEVALNVVAMDGQLQAAGAG